MKAGTFTMDENGTMRGRIQALGLGNLDAVFAERTSKEGKTYFRVIADPDGSPFEIGSAWPKEKDGLKYYSVSLDTIYSEKPINAALFPDRTTANSYNLVWKPMDVKPAAKAAAKDNAEPTPPAEAHAEPKTGTKAPKKRSTALSATL